MILLLGFKNFDDHDCEYQVTGDELLRLAALMGHPVPRKGAWAHVTFFTEDLDSVPEFERVKGEGDDGQINLFSAPGSAKR